MSFCPNPSCSTRTGSVAAVALVLSMMLQVVCCEHRATVASRLPAACVRSKTSQYTRQHCAAHLCTKQNQSSCVSGSWPFPIVVDAPAKVAAFLTFVACRQRARRRRSSLASLRHVSGNSSKGTTNQGGCNTSAPLVIIAGPPAAGKGTQCNKIKELFGYIHVSTGDLIRANVRQGTELGRNAEKYVDAGELVPTSLIVDLVKERLMADDVRQRGCLLDGFPRTIDQAQVMFDAGIKVDKFIRIIAPDDLLVERGCGRRVDPENGEIYHLKFRPPPPEVEARLVHRSDDREEAIRHRLRVYNERINAVSTVFHDVLVDVDGTQAPDEVFDSIKTSLL
eukprot:TRINITY_DN50446_c0_g1_i1.p1 TRINITY_DN50446_c0_g1~~TRINITY_DN50446_c0_g1_i1.p1  ORF type:complete len:337 (+),score=36.98 TRINITY_DN50446_c0_g1_i1:246-1256(+)